MELGALVCTPAAPALRRLPTDWLLRSPRLGLQGVIPPKPKPPRIGRREAGVVLRDRPASSLAQRPTGASRWANLWEFPHGELATASRPSRRRPG